MSRLILAFRAFFAVLFGRVPAEAMAALLAGQSPAAPIAAPGQKPVPSAPPRAAEPVKRSRSEAITLLAALQREARFVDLVQEPLNQYTDEQIGAAARDVLRDCRQVLARMFALEPVVVAEENSEVETPGQLSSQRWRISGKVAGEPPFRGRLVHHGWEAKQCELPLWSGDSDDARVIAPAEISC